MLYISRVRKKLKRFCSPPYMPLPGIPFGLNRFPSVDVINPLSCVVRACSILRACSLHDDALISDDDLYQWPD